LRSAAWSNSIPTCAIAVPCARTAWRTVIEHKLAHISQRQGDAARYVGVRENTFDLRRASAIQNLETLHLLEVQPQKVA
jgi:hypothetical protein